MRSASFTGSGKYDSSLRKSSGLYAPGSRCEGAASTVLGVLTALGDAERVCLGDFAFACVSDEYWARREAHWSFRWYADAVEGAMPAATVVHDGW